MSVPAGAWSVPVGWPISTPVEVSIWKTADGGATIRVEVSDDFYSVQQRLTPIGVANLIELLQGEGTQT